MADFQSPRFELKKSIWLIPAGISVLVLLLFTALFKNEQKNSPQ
ncbi:hypothetical protein SAMN04489724_4615 [Algoriphagus locisalis]|uniref:Uncharacterized protein n=1 Tax=Algoriphagus locisalis TaxID=305507 RepID=A0A1I7E0C6_9BACT|nr:hypothetical protein SAMN04489724_4615 [Algoriphagus locisalis]